MQSGENGGAAVSLGPRKTPLKRTPLSPSKGPKRSKAMRNSSPKRLWADADRKLAKDVSCRSCGVASLEGLERAHLAPRRYDTQTTGSRGAKCLYVHPDNVVWLCGKFAPGRFLDMGCHYLFDSGRLNLWPKLSLSEKKHVVRVLGKEGAKRRLAPASLGGVRQGEGEG
jgi:hypothetical protein